MAELSSMYAAYAKPFEYVVDSRGRKTPELAPFDPSSKRFVLGLVMSLPVLLGLVMHLFEPGLLTTDKKRKGKSK